MVSSVKGNDSLNKSDVSSTIHLVAKDTQQKRPFFREESQEDHSSKKELQSVPSETIEKRDVNAQSAARKKHRESRKDPRLTDVSPKVAANLIPCHPLVKSKAQKKKEDHTRSLLPSIYTGNKRPQGADHVEPRTPLAQSSCSQRPAPRRTSPPRRPRLRSTTCLLPRSTVFRFLALLHPTHPPQQAVALGDRRRPARLDARPRPLRRRPMVRPRMGSRGRPAQATPSDRAVSSDLSGDGDIHARWSPDLHHHRKPRRRTQPPFRSMPLLRADPPDRPQSPL